MSLIEEMGLSAELSTAERHGLVAVEGKAARVTAPPSIWSTPSTAKCSEERSLERARTTGRPSSAPRSTSAGSGGSPARGGAGFRQRCPPRSAVLIAAARRALLLSEWDLTERLTTAASAEAPAKPCSSERSRSRASRGWTEPWLRSPNGRCRRSTEPEPRRRPGRSHGCRGRCSTAATTNGRTATVNEVIARRVEAPDGTYRRMAFAHCAMQAMNAPARPDDAVQLAELARSPLRGARRRSRRPVVGGARLRPIPAGASSRGPAGRSRRWVRGRGRGRRGRSAPGQPGGRGRHLRLLLRARAGRTHRRRGGGRPARARGDVRSGSRTDERSRRP